MMAGLLLCSVCVGSSIEAEAFINLDLNRIMSGATKLLQAATISDEAMAQYVAASVIDMDSKNKVAPANSPYTVRLNRLTAGVTQADGIPLNFKVYETTDVNAFACPDGSVRVYSGLMDKMTDTELAGIIGHEIGHVVKRHSREAFKKQLMTEAVKDGVASVHEAVAALTDSQLGALGTALINARYSRKQEEEADNFGYDYLVYQGYNPWGMVSAFEKFQAMEGGAGMASPVTYVQKMFSSHPDTQSRIEAMTKRCIKDNIERPSATTTTTTTTSAKATTTTAKTSTVSKKAVATKAATKKTTTKKKK